MKLYIVIGGLGNNQIYMKKFLNKLKSRSNTTCYFYEFKIDKTIDHYTQIQKLINTAFGLCTNITLIGFSISCKICFDIYRSTLYLKNLFLIDPPYIESNLFIKDLQETSWTHYFIKYNIFNLCNKYSWIRNIVCYILLFVEKHKCPRTVNDEILKSNIHDILSVINKYAYDSLHDCNIDTVGVKIICPISSKYFKYSNKFSQNNIVHCFGDHHVLYYHPEAVIDIIS